MKMANVKKASSNHESIILDQIVGMRVMERRAEIGFTQVGLAEIMDLSKTAVRSIELGWRRPTPAQLLSLAYALGVKVSYFFEGVQVSGSSAADLYLS